VNRPLRSRNLFIESTTVNPLHHRATVYMHYDDDDDDDD